MIPVSSWGRLSAEPHHVITLNELSQVDHLVTAAPLPGLAHGMGRSYGDVCLNPQGTLWRTTGLDRFIAFDEQSGRLVCEAGVLLYDIQRLMMPRGWCLAVTPGTQMVTVGGAIANDVHGKNHHRSGSFGDHVLRIVLQRTDGEVIDCPPDSDWFAATVGGLGLTGVIVQAEIQLQRVDGPWLECETIPYKNLDRFFHLADSSEQAWEHTVSWVDCLSGAKGRGVFLRANPCDNKTQQVPQPSERKLSMPIVPPLSLVNKLSLRLFNSAYYRMKRWRAGRALTYYEPFFYPLDNVLHWNRMYGPKGFYQYQSVVPRDAGHDATAAMLREIKRAGEGSFLTVLKTFGNRSSVGMLGFPRPGVTLALDFANRGERSLKLFESLDAIVREAGGCLYPAKDARMPRDLFESGYPRLNEFLNYRDPGISSAMSRRLMGS